MRYLFLAPIYRKEEENTHLALSNGIMAPSSNIFPWEIINGLEEQGDNVVDIVNVLPVGTYPRQYKKMLLKTKRWSHNGKSENTEIGSVNLLFLKQIIRTHKIKKALNKWIGESKNNNTVLIYFLYLPFLRAIRKLPKDVNAIAIVPDLPQFLDLSAKKIMPMKLFRHIAAKMAYRSLDRVNGYILIAEQMRDLLDLGSKPYAVMEGISPQMDCGDIPDLKNEHIVILYAGTLNYQYGIRDLLLAFSKIEDDNYRLWICGVGEAAKDIVRLSESDKRIIFYGHVNKGKVFELQRQATILINPRKNEGEYTKYSFPSKTMEYMSSGRPVVMYKLDGVPDEYDSYLHYVAGDTVDDLKKKIVEICSESPEELREFGLRAREWVVQEKNRTVQIKKIIDIAEELQVVL